MQACWNGCFVPINVALDVNASYIGCVETGIGRKRCQWLRDSIAQQISSHQAQDALVVSLILLKLRRGSELAKNWFAWCLEA